MKAETEHLVATVFLAFGVTWGMPLLLTIPGMGVWYSQRSRGPATFARSGCAGSGVPLLVGLLTLVPLQVWLGLRRGGDPATGAVYGAGSASGDPVTGMEPPGRGLPAAQERRRPALGGGHPGTGRHLALYEFGVRRTAVTRALFGLKPHNA